MKKILAGIIALVLSVTALTTPVFATSTASSFGAETVVLTSCANKKGGGGIFCILGIVIDIMTAAIGALGVLGIIITGVQYVTASGNEEKVKKAKKRLIEIIIGLVAYAVAYTALQWLVPGLNTDSGDLEQEYTQTE